MWHTIPNRVFSQMVKRRIGDLYAVANVASMNKITIQRSVIGQATALSHFYILSTRENAYIVKCFLGSQKC